MVGAYTWITVILNGNPLEMNRYHSGVLRLHPSTVFWALLLTMRATPFFSKVLVHSSRYNGHLN